MTSIVADTNVLVRSIVRDDAQQAATTDRVLREATHIIVPLQTLCELVWVLTRAYRRPRQAVSLTIRELMRTANVVADRRAVSAGLAMLDVGCDFADGIINFDGARMGGEIFVTFDRRAAQQLASAGAAVELLQ